MTGSVSRRQREHAYEQLMLSRDKEEDSGLGVKRVWSDGGVMRILSFCDGEVEIFAMRV